MKSDDITIQQLFQDRRQYMVPFYQRSYVWTLTNQWEQLWEDIQAKADARLLGNKFTPHFLGAEESMGRSSVYKFISSRSKPS